MKKNLLLSLLLLTSYAILTGQTGTIKGTIEDVNGPLGFATVILYAVTDSMMVKAAISSDDGSFELRDIPFGDYFLNASFLGYQTFSGKPFTVNSKEVFANEILLSEASALLEEVVVKSAKALVEVQADKTVFNVENTINASGNSALELLRKAPGVILDNNDRVILEGKTGVQYFIDGKPSLLAGDDLMNYLRTLQADDIAAIEIITQPSARYDAAGNAGIINIRLKKDKRLGTNGSVAVGVSQGRNTRMNSSLSFNNRTRKSNTFGSYQNRIGKSWSFIHLDRIQNDIRYDSESETVVDNEIHNARLGWDYYLNDKHTFGVLLNGNFLDAVAEEQTLTPIIPPGSSSPEEILIANNSGVGSNRNLNGNINYTFRDTFGRKLNIDMDYGRYNRENDALQPNLYQDANTQQLLLERNFRMITPAQIDIVTAKLDYEQSLGSGTIAFGGKYSNVTTDNTMDFYDVVDGVDYFNPDRSNRFVYKENINAVYLNYSGRSRKWSYQFGLRAEQTHSNGTLSSSQVVENSAVDRRYLDWFPSGGLTYSANPNSSWALNYSRRIQRPNYAVLNPFETQLDELSFQKGNPFLQPQYTDNVKLSHTYKYRLTTSLSYSYIKDFFAQITDTLGSTRNFLMSRNIANQQIINLGVSYPFSVQKWWSVYLSVNAFHASYQGADEKFNAVERTTASIYASNTFLLPNGFKLEVSGWANSPSVWGGTYLTKSMGSLDIALQKNFLTDRLTMRLAVNDIFFTSPWRADMEYGGLYIDGTGGWESRQVRLNISYNLGRKEIQSSRKRKIGLEDENKRVGG